MSSKAKFLDSYEMKLVKEFKPSILYFALSNAGAVWLTLFLFLAAAVIGVLIGKCVF